MLLPEVKWILQSASCTPVWADRNNSEVKSGFFILLAALQSGLIGTILK